MSKAIKSIKAGSFARLLFCTYAYNFKISCHIYTECEKFTQIYKILMNINR